MTVKEAAKAIGISIITVRYLIAAHLIDADKIAVARKPGYAFEVLDADVEKMKRLYAEDRQWRLRAHKKRVTQTPAIVAAIVAGDDRGAIAERFGISRRAVDKRFERAMHSRALKLLTAECVAS